MNTDQAQAEADHDALLDTLADIATTATNNGETPLQWRVTPDVCKAIRGNSTDTHVTLNGVPVIVLPDVPTVWELLTQKGNDAHYRY